MKKLFIIACAAFMTSLFSGERVITGEEMLGMQLPSTPLLTLPADNWRCIYADNKKFADPDFDDSAWTKVQINRQLSGKNRPQAMPEDYRQSKSHCWYRYTFELPEKTPSNNFELRLGQVSAGDQTFVNGHFIGSFGFDKRVNKSSSKERIYLSSGDKAILRPGKNVIAVRCKIGHLRGMHTGIVEFRKLPDLYVTGRFTHHSTGATAICRQITAREELNKFTPLEKIFCRPELTVFSPEGSLKGTVQMELTRQNKVVWSKTLPMQLKAGKYVSPEIQELPKLASGKYGFSIRFSTGEKILWQKDVPVSVAPAEKFSFPANAELKKYDSAPLPLTVAEASFSSFGPRNVGADNKLFDDYKRPDTRGTPLFLTVSGPECKGAVLGLSHIKPTPAAVNTKLVSHSIGGRFDHFTDMWILGEVIAAGKKQEVPTPSTEEVWWTGKKVRYSYASGGSFSMTSSLLSPALTFEAKDLSSMLFFAPTRWKRGAPTKVYIPQKGRLTAVTSAKLTGNWLILSFEGNPAYDEFNIPVLMVFEKAPSKVNLISKGLRTFFNDKSSGKIHVMPLYGLTLQAPGKLPDNAMETARKWSKILPVLPSRVERTARIDYNKNRLLFQDKFIWANGKSSANTYLPVPPTLLLARRGGMDISASQAVEDFDLATMSGPFAVVRGGDTVTWALDGVANYVREVRQTVDIADTPEAKAARARLEATVRQIAGEIKDHPWKFIAKNKGKGEIGGLEPFFSNLLMAVEYLPENLKKQIHSDIIAEMPLTIFNDDFKIPGRKPGTMIPINTKVFSPLSKKTFSALTRHHKDNGVDCPCWEALRLCMYEHIGRAADADGLLKKNLKQINCSYDLIVNSHDWSYSASWDSFGGVRVGNGFQENTIFHAGLIAYARMIRRLGMKEESDKAAYYALMQLVGTKSCASESTLDYLRRVRPVLASSAHYSRIEILENLRPYHHLEINERTGFYHTVINAESSYDSHGFIMTRLPEVMRPFMKVWGDYSAAHINFVRPGGKTFSHIQPPPVDHFLYVTGTHPFPLKKLIELRLAPEVRSKLPLHQQLADDRAALEVYGKTVYRRLW